jgi:hypothetical protein
MLAPVIVLVRVQCRGESCFGEMEGSASKVYKNLRKRSEETDTHSQPCLRH